MVNLVPIIILLSLDYKIYHQIYHFVRIISVFCDLSGFITSSGFYLICYLTYTGIKSEFISSVVHHKTELYLCQISVEIISCN